MSVEGTSARAWVGVSAPVAPQLADTALPHLTPASPRRLGAIRSRIDGVPARYWQHPRRRSNRRFAASGNIEAWLDRLRTKDFWLVEDDVFGRDDHACPLSVMGACREGIDAQTRVVSVFRYRDGRQV